MALPFATNAACFLLGRRARSRASRRRRGRSGADHDRLLADMAEGVRWLVASPADADAGAHDPASSTSRSARPGRCSSLYAVRAPGDGRGRVRAADDRRRRRRGLRDAVLRPARAAVRPRRHHAGRPDHRDVHPSRPRADDVGRGRARDAGRVRRPTRSSGARPRPSSASAPSRTSCWAGSAGVYRVAIMGGIVIGTPLGGLLARSSG